MSRFAGNHHWAGLPINGDRCVLCWQGSWRVGIWLLLSGIAWGQEPLLIPRADDVTQVELPLKLSRPATMGAQRPAGTSTPNKAAGGWGTVTGSLVLVLGVIVAAGYVMSRQRLRLPGLLPNEVIQVLGKKYIDSRNSVQLIRCGSKILVLVNSTQHGLRTLSEITDPIEVEQITGQCLPTSPSSPRAAIYPPHTASLRQSRQVSGGGGPRG